MVELQVELVDQVVDIQRVFVDSSGLVESSGLHKQRHTQNGQFECGQDAGQQSLVHIELLVVLGHCQQQQQPS